MSRFTQSAFIAADSLARKETNVEQLNKAKRFEYRLKEAIFGKKGPIYNGITTIDFVSTDLSDLTKSTDNHFMFGALIVKDLAGNQHRIITRPSVPIRSGVFNPLNHAEAALFDALNGMKIEGKINAAKVVIAMRSSPCQKCTANITGWCKKAAEKITGGIDRCFFVFNFREYYTHSDNDPHNIWIDSVTAKKAYDKISVDAGFTRSLTYTELNSKSARVGKEPTQPTLQLLKKKKIRFLVRRR